MRENRATCNSNGSVRQRIVDPSKKKTSWNKIILHKNPELYLKNSSKIEKLDCDSRKYHTIYTQVVKFIKNK